MVATSCSGTVKLDLVPPASMLTTVPGGPEVLRPPAHLRVAGPVEPAGHRRDRRNVDGLFGHRPVGDRPLEVDVDRLGGSGDGPVGRVERRRREHRFPDVRCRVLPCRGAFWNDLGRQRTGRERRPEGTGSPAVAAAPTDRRAAAGGANGSGGGGTGAAAGSIGAGGGGGISGCASADGLPNAVSPTSPTANIAPTSFPLVRCRIRHLQSHTTSSSLAQRGEQLSPRGCCQNPDNRPVKAAELLCSSPQGAQCYFALVAEGTSKRPRVNATPASATTTRTADAAIMAANPACS